MVPQAETNNQDSVIILRLHTTEKLTSTMVEVAYPSGKPIQQVALFCPIDQAGAYNERNRGPDRKENQ